MQDCSTAEERVPFLIVNDNSIIEIVPLLPFKADAFNLNSPTYSELQKPMVKFKFTSERWVHIGFNVRTTYSTYIVLVFLISDSLLFLARNNLIIVKDCYMFN